MRKMNAREENFARRDDHLSWRTHPELLCDVPLDALKLDLHHRADAPALR